MKQWRDRGRKRTDYVRYCGQGRPPQGADHVIRDQKEEGNSYVGIWEEYSTLIELQVQRP